VNPFDGVFGRVSRDPQRMAEQGAPPSGIYADVGRCATVLLSRPGMIERRWPGDTRQ